MIHENSTSYVIEVTKLIHIYFPYNNRYARSPICGYQLGLIIMCVILNSNIQIMVLNET